MCSFQTPHDSLRSRVDDETNESLPTLVSGFLADELTPMQRNRCQRHEKTNCSLHVHLTWVVIVLLVDEVVSVMGEP